MLLTRRHWSKKIKRNSEWRWHRGKKYWIANKNLHLLHWRVFPSNHFPSPSPFTQLQDRNNKTYWNTREISHKCGYMSRHVTQKISVWADLSTYYVNLVLKLAFTFTLIMWTKSSWVLFNMHYYFITYFDTPVSYGGDNKTINCRYNVDKFMWWQSRVDE